MLASKNFHTLGDTFKIELRSMVILIFWWTHLMNYFFHKFHICKYYMYFI
jgi:hypothetical protein